MRIQVERYKRMLETKHAELLAATRHREGIAVDRSPDVIDEIQAAVDQERAVLELDHTSRFERVRTGSASDAMNLSAPRA